MCETHLQESKAIVDPFLNLYQRGTIQINVPICYLQPLFRHAWADHAALLSFLQKSRPTDLDQVEAIEQTMDDMRKFGTTCYDIYKQRSVERYAAYLAGKKTKHEAEQLTLL